MTEITKTAIESAEKRLEEERQEKLKEQVYQFLKGELIAIDELNSKIKELNEQKLIHEENVKNIKGGNLEAIEKRRRALGQNTIEWVMIRNPHPNYWYNHILAGTILTINGKRFIF